MVVSSHISLRVVKTLVDPEICFARPWSQDDQPRSPTTPSLCSSWINSRKAQDSKKPGTKNLKARGIPWGIPFFFWRLDKHSAEVVGAFVQFTGKSVGRHRADRGGIVIHGDLTMLSKGFNMFQPWKVWMYKIYAIYTWWLRMFWSMISSGVILQHLYYVGKSMNWISTWKLTFFWAG